MWKGPVDKRHLNKKTAAKMLTVGLLKLLRSGCEVRGEIGAVILIDKIRSSPSLSIRLTRRNCPLFSRPALNSIHARTTSSLGRRGRGIWEYLPRGRGMVSLPLCTPVNFCLSQGLQQHARSSIQGGELVAIRQLESQSSVSRKRSEVSCDNHMVTGELTSVRIPFTFHCVVHCIVCPRAISWFLV